MPRPESAASFRRPFARKAGNAILVLGLASPALIGFSAAPERVGEPLRPEAEVSLIERVRRDNSDADAHHHLGLLALARRDYAEAIPHLERAAVLVPENASYQFHFGAACVQQADRSGKTLKALGLARRGRQAMERSVELSPETVEFQQGLIEFYSRAPSIAGGGLEKARDAASAFRERHPREGALALTGVHLRARQPAEAIAIYEQLLATHADDYGVLYLLGKIAADTGEALPRGIAALRRCLELAPPPKAVPSTMVQHQLGRVLQRAGDLDGARTAYAAAVALEPQNEAARSALESLP